MGRIEVKRPGPKPWYPGHSNPKIRMATEMCMGNVVGKIEKRNESKLTTGQYNSVYEAVESIITMLQEER